MMSDLSRTAKSERLTTIFLFVASLLEGISLYFLTPRMIERFFLSGCADSYLNMHSDCFHFLLLLQFTEICSGKSGEKMATRHSFRISLGRHSVCTRRILPLSSTSTPSRALL